MPYTNPFFSNTTGYSGEVDLLDDLTREQISIYGMDILYMPRKMLNLDKLLKESTKSAFEVALPIPMYLKTFDGLDNGMELLTKFGVRSSDQITLQMSWSVTSSYGPFIEDYYKARMVVDLNSLEGQTSASKEGDLIYFPFDDSLFEIQYVQFDQPFFQFGQVTSSKSSVRSLSTPETFSTGYGRLMTPVLRWIISN